MLMFPERGVCCVHPPQEVVGQLDVVGSCEVGDADPERVDGAKDVLDRAVLARGVHPLEHDQDLVPAVGVEHLLEIGEVLVQLWEGGPGRLLAPSPAVGRPCGPVRQVHARAREHPVLRGIDRHGVQSRPTGRSVPGVPRVRLGVALLVPAPWCHEIDGLRRGTGEAHLDRVPPHITLVPPVNVPVDEVPSALARLRDAASGLAPFGLRLGPPTSFAPVTPTLHLDVGDDPAGPGGSVALRRLRDAVFVAPLRRSLTFDFAPHVTVRDELAPRLVEMGIEALSDYEVDVTFDRVHLLEEQRHGDARRRWVPVADVAFGPRRVVGRGGVELELTISTILDPEATAFEGAEHARALVDRARRDVVVRRRWSSPPVSVVGWWAWCGAWSAPTVVSSVRWSWAARTGVWVSPATCWPPSTTPRARAATRGRAGLALAGRSASGGRVSARRASALAESASDHGAHHPSGPVDGVTGAGCVGRRGPGGGGRRRAADGDPTGPGGGRADPARGSGPVARDRVRGWQRGRLGDRDRRYVTVSVAGVRSTDPALMDALAVPTARPAARAALVVELPAARSVLRSGGATGRLDVVSVGGAPLAALTARPTTAPAARPLASRSPGRAVVPSDSPVWNFRDVVTPAPRSRNESSSTITPTRTGRSQPIAVSGGPETNTTTATTRAVMTADGTATIQKSRSFQTGWW